MYDIFNSIDLALSGRDLSIPYFVICWIGAGISVIEMQKIANQELMGRVRASMRHLVRLLLALLGVALVWNGYSPIYYKQPPWPSDLFLATMIALLISAHAAAGCEWSRQRDN